MEPKHASEYSITPTGPDDYSGNIGDLISKSDRLGQTTQGYKCLSIAQPWTGSTNPKGLYISPKLEAIHCFWDGENMWSVRGKKYSPPKYFVEGFPKGALDGWLMMGEGNMGKCIQVIKKARPSEIEWNELRFVVLDSPGLEMPFYQRLMKLKEVFSNNTNPYIKLQAYERCEGVEHFDKAMKQIESTLGNGIRLKNPESFYITGRKGGGTFEVRARYEGIGVVGSYLKGRGKNETDGKVVGLEIISERDGHPNGVSFKISKGLPRNLEKGLPGVGSNIVYSFKGLFGNGTPKTPTFIRIL